MIDALNEAVGHMQRATEQADALADGALDAPCFNDIVPGAMGRSLHMSVAKLRAALQRQDELLQVGRPLLVGWSRKGTLGRLLDRPVQSRTAGSVAAALAAVLRGASIVRVHDVAATVDALKVWMAAGLAPNHEVDTRGGTQ